MKPKTLCAPRDDHDGDTPRHDQSARAVWDARAPLPSAFRCEHGEHLPDAALHIRLEGPADAPVVVALGGVSAHRRVADARPGETEEGWWPAMARPGGGVDPERVRIFSMDYAPADPAAPIVMTTRDHARLLALALDAAGVDRAHAIVGASFGGCVALAFAALFPERVDRLAVLCAAHRPNVTATAWRGVQRRILALASAAGSPEDGVALARQLAMITYRSAEEFERRFAPGLSGEDDASEVCGYLTARGRAHAGAVSAARYATLSASLDRHAVDPATITTPTLLLAADSDRLVPVADMAALRDALAGPATLEVIPARNGHDSFLTQAADFGRPLKRFLDAGLEPAARRSGRPRAAHAA